MIVLLWRFLNFCCLVISCITFDCSWSWNCLLLWCILMLILNSFEWSKHLLWITFLICCFNINLKEELLDYMRWYSKISFVSFVRTIWYEISATNEIWEYHYHVTVVIIKYVPTISSLCFTCLHKFDRPNFEYSFA